MNNKGIINYFSTLKVAYDLDKNISFHTLRHSFATFYLMAYFPTEKIITLNFADFLFLKL